MEKLVVQAPPATVRMVALVRNAAGNVTYTDPLNVPPEVMAVLNESDLLHLELLQREARKAL